MGRGSDLFELLENEQPFFSLKLVYNTDDVLEYAALDGKEMKDFRRRESVKVECRIV